MSLCLAVFAVVALVLFAVLVYAGLLRWFTLEIVDTKSLSFDRLQVVYRPHVGEYKNAWVAFQELKSLLAAANNFPCRVFGVYYDDPAKGKDKCRYIVGAVLAEGGDIEKEDAERKRVIAHFEKNGFSLTVLPKISHALYTTFPYRCGWLSIMLAVFIVYKKFGDAIAKVAGNDDRGIMELYDGDVIRFAYPLDEPSDKLMASEFKSKST